MKKLITILLVLLLVTSFLFSKGSNEERSFSDSSDPFAEYVELIMYSSGTNGKDTEKIMAEFNKQLKEKCNTTINVTNLGWDNYMNQYQLILTTGEPADLMYCNANIYSTYATNGAFADLTAIFEPCMPVVYGYFTPEKIAQAKIDGKIYMIPSYVSNYFQSGIFYRLDLAKKYGIDEINSLDTFEAYADAIVENEKGIRVIDGKPEQALFQMFIANYGFEPIAGSLSSIVVVNSYDDIHNIVAYPFTDEYVEWAHRMKEWADKGYWSSNALSSTMDPWSSIQVGTSAITQANPDGAKNMMSYMAQKMPDAECAYWNFSDLLGYSYVYPVTGDGFAVPASSPNAERALRVLEIIKTDQELYDLWMYGIEGYNYSLSEEGNLIKPAIGMENANVSDHSMSGAQYAMRVASLMRENEGVWEGYDELLTSLKAMEVPNLFGAVTIDYSEVQSELAAVNQVVQQYGSPINIGIVDDVDVAIKEYQKQLKAAGIDRLVEVISEQMEAYYKENGIV